jgi:hypothetical protein
MCALTTLNKKIINAQQEVQEKEQSKVIDAAYKEVVQNLYNAHTERTKLIEIINQKSGIKQIEILL